MAPAPVTLCGSLSLHPVSLGAKMHAAGYQALGLPYVYVPFAVQPEHLPGALAGMRALNIRGFGISMPFKLAILPLLDRLDPQAERIGAVNTVVNDGGMLTGYNTDAAGALRALEEVDSVHGKRAVVIGAGGAARAVASALLDAGALVHIANRTPERAAALAAELGAVRPALPAGPSSGALSDLPDLRAVQILVNGSSAGMADYGAASPVPQAVLHAGLTVMDIVYKPIETELLRAAARAGARTVHGGRMLLHQAARQFELYTGRTAPLQAMDAALQSAL